jgi:hypothetical protein
VVELIKVLAHDFISHQKIIIISNNEGWFHAAVKQSSPCLRRRLRYLDGEAHLREGVRFYSLGKEPRASRKH